MSKKDFIKNKLSLIEKDNQEGFKNFVGPLQDMAEEGQTKRIVQVPADGNWFTLDFRAVEVKNNRLVIEARRTKSGMEPCSYDPSVKEYIVEFSGTRAAYIRGFYKPRHPVFAWPYIYWDVRSYANHPSIPEIRVYVNSFRARDEIRKLITAMEGVYGTSHIVNKYINDNLLRFQLGIKAKKTPQQIEKEWSQGLMESLGYHHVEAFDAGYPKGNWKAVDIHWCKKMQDLRG